MRTTVRLDDGLLEMAKEEARNRHKTLTQLIEEGLRVVLQRRKSEEPEKKVTLCISRRTGGVLPGVDLNSSAVLLDQMEVDLPLEKRR